MTNFNWKIQLSEFYSDQFEDKGLVDKEKAVEAFQFFPWEKEVDDFNGRNDNPTAPRIIFTAPDNRVLDISTINLDNFYVEYSNFTAKKYSEFYISNDFNKKNWTIEELIEFFFDNSLEEHIKLENILDETEETETIKKEKKPAKNIEFSFKPQHLKILSILPFFWLGFSIVLIFTNKIMDAQLPLFIHLFLLSKWLPSFIVHLNYYLKNNNSKVIIDIKNHDLTYIKEETEIKFNRDDIFRAQVTIVDRGSMINYSYVWFMLKDKRYVTITCFIADPYEIVETLNCRYEERTRWIPLLP